MSFVVQLWRFFYSTAQWIIYLFRSAAPAAVYRIFFLTILERIHCRKYTPDRLRFKAEIASLKCSNDWFSLYVPFWLSIFKRYDLFSKKMQVLEIGSWEGVSSYFILKTLPQAHLTCVDTWEGSDEHIGQDILDAIEKNFDANLLPYKDRLTKFKGTSYSFFNTQEPQEKYDLIYADGSHYADDVLIDAIKGFALLKVGGLLIFDDYLWDYYDNVNDNPAPAINAFLRLKQGSYKIIHVYSQLVIEKTKSTN